MKLSLSRRFSVGSKVVFRGKEFFGSPGVVSAVFEGGGLSVSLVVVSSLADEAKKRSLLAERDAAEEGDFYPLHAVSRMVEVTIPVLEVVCSSLLTSPKAFDLGMHLLPAEREQKKWQKRGGGVKIPGYSIESDGRGGSPAGFRLSQKAVDAILQFRKRFPDLFASLLSFDRLDRPFRLDELFPKRKKDDLTAAAVEVVEWLSSQEFAKIPSMEASDLRLSTEAIRHLVADVEKMSSAVKSYRVVHLRNVSSVYLFAPPLTFIQSTLCSIGDRVVNVSDSGPVPFGLWGRAVAVRGSFADVLFDDAFLESKDIGESGSAEFGQTCGLSSLLNVSNPTASLSRMEYAVVKEEKMAASAVEHLLRSLSHSAQTPPPHLSPVTAAEESRGTVPLRTDGLTAAATSASSSAGGSVVVLPPSPSDHPASKPHE